MGGGGGRGGGGVEGGEKDLEGLGGHVAVVYAQRGETGLTGETEGEGGEV